MPKFPEPPSLQTLITLGAVLQTLPPGIELWRIYFRGGPYPSTWRDFRHFGPVAHARFDHHLPPPHVQQRGILYAAAGGLTTVAEVFQRRRTIDTASGHPWLVGFATEEALALLDLTGLWPTSAGASTALSSGPRPRAQRWSQAIYGAFPDVQGL